MSNIKPIQFTAEHITVKILGDALHKSEAQMLGELTKAGEKPAYGDKLNPNSILGWNTIKAACTRAGFQAVDARQPAVDPQNPGKDVTISKKEWAIIRPAAKEAANFHRTYGQTIQEAIGESSPEAAKEMAEFHNNYATNIENTIKQVDRQLSHKKKGPDEPTI